MDIEQRLAKERRARLAAERLLEYKQRELFAANEKLAMHARALSDQIIEQRAVVKVALSEAEKLKGQNSRFLDELDRAHTAAVMAERRLWDSINTIGDGFAVFDSRLKLVAANEAYLAHFGGPALRPGMSLADMLRLALEEGVFDLGTEPSEDWTARMTRCWDDEPGEPVVLHRPCGSWLRLANRRARDGDMVSLLIDITEQMRLRAAIDAIPDGFVLFDRNERLVLCNDRYREIHPKSAESMQPGASFESILRHGLERGQYRDALGREEDWLAARLASFRALDGASEQQLDDGRWLRVIEHGTPDGGRVGLRVDITEMKLQQEALETARAAAEAASRAKSAFLANMSHEIRTPMNGVVGMAELLCETPLTEDQRLFAETIRSSGEALLVIINDILDYSKIEANRLTIHPEPFDFERTIHEVAMLLQPRARAKGIDLLIDFDMFLPTRYVGDPGRLRQVLTNLIGNAVKFTEQGHVLIRVVGLEAEPGHHDLHVTVEDTGIGISSDNLEHVFGEFNQIDAETNRRFEGTGLGLAITRRLIELMEGTIWVDSELGRGSCFGFRLTLPAADDAAAPPRPLQVHRALVVDDQFINRTILERQLSPCGIDVTLCRSGAEALAQLAVDAGYDLLLTDHEMPDLDGLALADRVREAGWTMPILLLTSNPSGVRDNPAMRHLSGMLQKPLLRSDLYRRLQTLTAPAPAPEPEPLPAVPLPRRMRVLAAEDNRTNQLVFRKMVRDLDIDLTFAGNGREAVDLFRQLDPDLVFMDISMPEMDGREAARTIRALEPPGRRVPIVALTAHAMESDAAQSVTAGIDRTLTKPLRRAAILEALAAFCPAEVRPLVPQDDEPG
ncbi:response regulator [Cereibacter sphaeroides]|uniref:hybrid sensor histidine kinase/response regulator n=1 Tax=Cereibacter sphaeroides TaxID=1063 RepID=UPI001F3EE00F|nr:response regulator [Cereibacter sphaeroides]MCE6960900.1 response regulator [Cereibacter sphaeroides]MCE6975277.1 response regulator [Cereibacter sphaeroides]